VRTTLPFFRGCANTFTLSALCENRVNDEICEAHAATTPLFDTVSGLLRTGDACTVALTDVAAIAQPSTLCVHARLWSLRLDTYTYIWIL
jgi:hypothetical protein